MGTEVFPNARLKIFLTASPEVRAQRRLEELVVRFPELSKEISLQSILQRINERDRFDSERPISPLKKAQDAYEVDTTNKSIEQVVFEILEIKDRARIKKDQQT